jgi:putative membrane protein
MAEQASPQCVNQRTMRPYLPYRKFSQRNNSKSSGSDVKSEMRRVAEQKGNAQEKAFAQQMVTDHTKTSNDLKELVTSGKVEAEIPTVIDSSYQSKLDKLKDASGKDFSSDFDSYQVSAHKHVVSLFERYAKGGDNSDLKDWAGETLPTLKHHLEMARELGKAPSVGQSK